MQQMLVNEEMRSESICGGDAHPKMDMWGIDKEKDRCVGFQEDRIRNRHIGGNIQGSASLR